MGQVVQKGKLLKAMWGRGKSKKHWASGEWCGENHCGGFSWVFGVRRLVCNAPKGPLPCPQPYPVTTAKVAKTLKKGRSPDWKSLYRIYGAEWVSGGQEITFGSSVVYSFSRLVSECCSDPQSPGGCWQPRSVKSLSHALKEVRQGSGSP